PLLAHRPHGSHGRRVGRPGGLRRRGGQVPERGRRGCHARRLRPPARRQIRGRPRFRGRDRAPRGDPRPPRVPARGDDRVQRAPPRALYFAESSMTLRFPCWWAVLAAVCVAACAGRSPAPATPKPAATPAAPAAPADGSRATPEQAEPIVPPPLALLAGLMP